MPIEITGDGSHTIVSSKYNVPYHSIHGALQETNHVFIKEGLNIQLQKLDQIRILEMGFGTGLNAAATLQAVEGSSKSVDYTAIEAFPIDLETFHALNYQLHLGETAYTMLSQMHKMPWDEKLTLTPNFRFKKHKIHLESYQPSAYFDLIYFDAFAPTAQPELWQPVILEKLFKCLDRPGMLVTYCAKGQFKRDLKAIGFEVENPPGPPRKREMTRALKV